MNYTEYLALDWRVLTNLGTETLSHTEDDEDSDRDDIVRKCSFYLNEF
jgi:hypothetical protein